MRIAFLCSEYPPAPSGGIGTMTRVLGHALAGDGHDVQVIGCYQQSTPSTAFDGPLRVTMLPCARTRFGWMEDRYRLYRVVARGIRDRKLDLLEVPDYQGWIAGWPKLPIPVIARLHGSSSYFGAEMGSHPGRIPFQLERASLRRADFICSTSRYAAVRTTELFHLNVSIHHILYNPVEVPSSVCRVRSPHSVVYTGTLAVKKGIVQLIKAWPAVHRLFPQAMLHIYGKDGIAPAGGSMLSYLRNFISPEIERAVVFHGHVSREEVLTALETARLAIFPSYAEAFALAPLEAMAHACPTIYTTRGSGSELIRHGEDGLLIDPDDVDSIAHAISTLLQNDSMAETFAAAGRRRVGQNFALPVLLKRNEKFYEHCIAAFRHSRS